MSFPAAPPPATPPPPPPQGTYAQIPQVQNYGSSYQHQADASAGVQRYDRVAGGDTTVNPNTGQTNDGVGGVGSLSEILRRLRWITLIVCGVTLLLELLVLPGRVLITFFTSPAKVVLACYLDIACLLMVGIDVIHPVLLNTVTIEVENDETNEQELDRDAPARRKTRRQSISDFLKDNVGFLYRPLGRAAALLWMAGMCVAMQLSWWEMVAAVGFVVLGFGYVYCVVAFPEYRTWATYHTPALNLENPDMDTTVWANAGGVQTESATSWSDPYSFQVSDPMMPHTVRRTTQTFVPEFIQDVVIRNLGGNTGSAEQQSLLGAGGINNR